MAADDKDKAGEPKETYSLGKGQKASDVYARLKGPRTNVEERSREMAELTVPSAFPPLGYIAGDDIPGNNQSVGAHCLNTLTSHLVFMAFPPNQPIARFRVLEYMVQDEVTKDPAKWAFINMAMSRLEVSHRERLMTTTIMTAYGEYVKQLLLAGNCLWRQLKLAEPVAYRCDTYVVKRNKVGMPLLIILEETVNLQGMLPEHVDLVYAHSPDEKFKDKPEWEREVTIHSCQKLCTEEGGEKVWRYWEEYEGVVLPGTSVETDFDTPPMHAGWLIPNYGQDWGRGYCEEYRGDLYSVENHASATNDGAALAGWSLTFVKPGSGTSQKKVQSAKNLSVLTGDAADVTVFRSEKTADFNFVMTSGERIERRLALAFLLQFAIQRDGERVTKEEITRLGTELDKAMGGLYTQIAQSNQRPIILRAIKLNEHEHPELPKLPDKVVEVQVITGIDALGDSTEAETLVEWGETMVKLFPKAAEQYIDVSDFGTRLGAHKGLKTEGLLKSADTMAAEQQQQMQQQAGMTLLDKATGPAVKGMADAMAQGGAPPQAPPPTAQQ